MKLIKSLIITLFSVLLLSAYAQTSNSFTPAQTKAIQNIIHDYLVNQPQVLIEASEALQKKEMVKAEEQAKTAIGQYGSDIFNDNTNPIAGNTDGSVTIVEFFDYQCPHCKDMAAILEKVIDRNNNVRVVFKELPIFGANSRFAAAAALAAYKMNPKSYLKFHNALMAASNPLSQDKVLKIAKNVGLNVDQLQKTMNDADVNNQIEANFKLAQELGIMGTPSFVIAKWNVGSSNNKVDNAKFIPGATGQDKLQEAIDQVK